ncbi:hypothetical protein AX14_006786 [Amanita brunnescens Koide BX004]|nr:hypothetical protein AX14_006786 [Amanita brunnescens Koide BX004]
MSWRAIETNKILVLRPGTKGTQVSELHIRVPKVSATAYLFSLSGTKLINKILCLVNETHNKAGIRALKENHLVLVKWSMRGNLIFKCSKLMDDVVKECLHDAVKAAVPPSSTDSIAILNKPPTTALKFSSVPRHNEDGTDTDSYNLHNDLMANELWRDVEIFSQPHFLPMKPDAAGGTVIVSVVDDTVSSVGRKLMNSVVNFSGASRYVKCGDTSTLIAYQTLCVVRSAPDHTTIANMTITATPVRWGKVTFAFPDALTAEEHTSPTAKSKWKEEEAALRAAANSDSGRAARATANASSLKPDTKGKGKTKMTTKLPKDDDAFIPIGKGGKAKYTFGGMAQALATTTRIDEVTDKSDNARSDDSSELRLSYLDDIPLRQHFLNPKPPTTTKPQALEPPIKKPLTITLPASGNRTPLRSVTDILRELKNPTGTKADYTDTAADPSKEAPTSAAHTADATTMPNARFGGTQVEYSSSALQHEADAFAEALTTSTLPSQPSPLSTHPDSLAPAALSQPPPNLND